MKYKLVNFQTKEEHLCDKVTIDEKINLLL